MPAKNELPTSLTFTLDTNCLIDVEEQRPAAVHVIRLLNAHAAGLVDIALVASSASERQPEGGFLEDMATFEERCRRLGFGGLDLLKPIMRWGVGFWNNGYWSWAEGEAREKEIYLAMFPTSPHEWSDFARHQGVDVADTSSSAYFRWRNQILDAQAYWAHENARRGTFVTSDKRFKKLEKMTTFSNASVKTPEEGVALL